MKSNKNINEKNSIFKNWLVIIVVILFIILPFIINAYWVDVLFFFGVYALLGLSLNIVLGEVGILYLGHM
jgi:branched-chain amino acid transport system permease protein